MGNFIQFHQLQELVEHLLEVQKKGRVELVFWWGGASFLVEWSEVEQVRCLGIFFHGVEPNLVEQNNPKHPLKDSEL